MSWRLLTVLSIAVALALLLVFGWRELAPTDLGVVSLRTPSDSPTAVNAARGADAPAAVGAVATAGRSEVTAQAAPQRRVRIVDESGAPVADAEVAFDVSRVDEPLAFTWSSTAGSDVEASMAEAPRLRSAVDGMVVLPTDAETAFLIARAGERFGCDVIDFGSRLVDLPELRIAPDRTLRIAVVGPRGEPCPSGVSSSALDGSFELWGPAGDDLVIHAQKSGYATSIQSIERRSRDVVVALQRALQLRATVLVDPGITVDGLGVRVQTGNRSVGWNTSQSRPGQRTCLFTLSDADDLVLEVAGAEEMPAVRQVPRSEWTAHDGMWLATVDLRDALAMARVTIRSTDADGVNSGSLYVRPLDSSTTWAELPLAPRMAFAAPKGTVMDAIVRPDFGMCLRATLQLGENTIDVPPPSVAPIEVTGMPADVAQYALGVQVCRLVRREPLLDELVAAGLDVDPGAVQHWPRSAADLEAMESTDFRSRVLEEEAFSFFLPRRGSYVAVPVLVASDYLAAKNDIALVDAAVALEITTPGAVVAATIRLDPEKVRAALR